ncbi:MAG: hypothetical protein IJT16_08860 [Lachnospiraceae bacterium]|nr:hypothetical protein [Lachnospiraceae bacterium]
MEREKELQEKVEQYAKRLIDLARDTVIVNMRFMDVALNRLLPVKKEGLAGIAADTRAGALYYDPGYILRCYEADENSTARMVLHALLHCVFSHSFGYGELIRETWDLSCDIAVENLIMELDLSGFTLKNDDRRQLRLKGLKKNIDRMTAERIYRYFLINPLAKTDRLEFEELFFKDRHIYWAEPEAYEISEEQWKRISERIKADIRTFSKNSSHSESLLKNLEAATKKRHDFRRELERFMVSGQELRASDEEFDYIYYTYGLSHYGNMPLIEPLEYRDVNKLKEFAIVLDTSASCRGDIIRSFLKKTYDIMKGSENFFQKINVHIIQCDNEVHMDTRIGEQADFDAFLKKGKLIGYGGTDFRPAFAYIDQLIEDGEFQNFKGLIYFTDGYGIYPVKAPEYDCLFAFMSEDDRKPEVPWWAIPLILQPEDLDEATK